MSLRHFLNQRIEDLRKLIPREGKSWTKESIHHARVGTRRMRAAIDLLKPVLSASPQKDFGKILRKLRKTLGPMRDHDVMLDHLQGLQGKKSFADAVTWLSRKLKTGRAELERKKARKLPSEKILSGLGRWWAVEVEIDEIEVPARALTGPTVIDQLKVFGDCAARVIESRRNAAAGTAEDVHRLRIAGKLLRYSLELAEPLGFDVPKRVFKSFKQLQDALGLWHDFVVLGECALGASVEEELALHYPALHGEILELARFCWKQSEHYLDQFGRLWQKHGEDLTVEIRAILLGCETPIPQLVKEFKEPTVV